jgi:choline dehydrogenase
VPTVARLPALAYDFDQACKKGAHLGQPANKHGGGRLMTHAYWQGEAVNALIEAAYRGRVGRRAFVRGLLAAGFTAAVARDIAEHAALAQAVQGAQLTNLKSEYDYIIVGAGSAGCVMAERLSKDGRFSVLVIEGGGTDIEQQKIAVPIMWPTNIGSDTDWGNKSIPQKHLANRVIPAPVGKIVGGGSSINATVWLRGDKADYDEWEAAVGPDWGFNSISASFKKIERAAGGESAYRGGSGPIANFKTAMGHPVTRAFIEASKEQGIPENADLNGAPSVLGAGQMDQNIANGRRVSAVHGFLLPALSRSNLTLLPAASVLRLDISAGQCRGVVASVQGQERRFAAGREVILCAGALHSPKILMLSGVGPADHLRQFGITVALDQPQIGANLHDHLLTRIYFRSKEKMPAVVDSGVSGTTYLKTRASLAGPDIQILGRQNAFGSPDLKPDEGYNILPGLMKPKSRGTVRLTSADPAATLAVDPNYFAEQADVDTYVAGVEIGIAIGNAKAFGDMRAEQVSLRGADKAQIVDYVRRTALTYFHFAGTCAMGKQTSAPVDPALRVRGVSRLRVVDASVMPTLPCANTNPPTLSLADKAAELVLAAV